MAAPRSRLREANIFSFDAVSIRPLALGENHREASENVSLPPLRSYEGCIIIL